MAKPRSNHHRAARAARAAQIRAARQRTIEEAARRHPDLLGAGAVGGLALAEREDPPAGEPVPVAVDASLPQVREDGTDADVVRRRKPTSVLVFLILCAKLLVFRLLVFGAPMPLMVAADLAAVAVLVGVVGLLAPGRASRPALWVLDAVVTVFLFAATVFEAHFQTVPTYKALTSAGQTGDTSESIVAILRPQFFLYVADLLLVPLLWWWGRRRGLHPPRQRPYGDRAVRFAALATIGVVVSSLVISAQAGVRNEVHLAETMGPLTYQANALLDGSRRAAKVEPGTAFERVSALKESRTGPVPDPQKARGFGAMAGKNLIVVQLEAVQDLPVGRSIDGQPLTPVLDGLAKSGYHFPNVFQQIGQGSTSDAEFMSNTSLYPSGEVAVSAAYGDRRFPSLPRLLRDRGYRSETFHVNDVSFWDRGQLYPALGFDAWHQQGDFEDDHFNSWGASDESLYATTVERAVELAEKGIPFYFQLVTAGSHHPFRIPEEHRRLDLPRSLEGTEVGNYLQAVRYADWAVGRLVAGLKEAGLYDDTMIALYGDHFGLAEDDGATMRAAREVDPDYAWGDHFNVPLIVHVPHSKGRVVEKVGGQLDIMPTLANLLGVDLAEEEFVFFGSDLLNTATHAFGVRFYQPTGSFYNDEVWFRPGGGFGDGTARSLSTMDTVTSEEHRTDYDYVLELMDLSDAYLESLPRVAGTS